MMTTHRIACSEGCSFIRPRAAWLLPMLTALCLAAVPAWSAQRKAEVVDAVQKGTLTNLRLRQDALVGVHAKLAASGCHEASKFEPYVTQLPAGTPGARTWQEVWVGVCSNGRYPVRVDFQESGMNAANWTIR